MTASTQQKLNKKSVTHFTPEQANDQHHTHKQSKQATQQQQSKQATQQKDVTANHEQSKQATQQKERDQQIILTNRASKQQRNTLHT